MKKIVGIGANVYDTLIILPEYPTEDSKLQAEKVLESGGGPVATGLTAAAKLGASCAYIGQLSDDRGGQFLLKDLNRWVVDTNTVRIKSGYQTFSSWIWLSCAAATRTCVFDKGNLPELQLDDAQRRAIAEAELLMVDGNDSKAAIEGAKLAREHGAKVLYDAGGLYSGIEELLPLADYLIPSEEFACRFTGEKTAEKAAESLWNRFHPELVAVTCGSQGGVLYTKDAGAAWYPAFPVDAVDTNGAGDVFHGAFAFAVVRGMTPMQCCIFSSAVSALKCTKTGARDGVPALNEIIQFLKERGYNEFKKILEK